MLPRQLENLAILHDKASRLWADSPYSLRSLWDIMQPYYADSHLTQVRALVATLKQLPPGGQLGDDIRAIAQLQFGTSVKYFALEGLTASKMTCEKLVSLLSKTDCPTDTFIELVGELQERLIDEMSAPRFFSLSDQEAEYYNNPCTGWEEIITRWPNTQTDIEESSKCFACNRYAAAIFHILLVAELGVIEIATLLGVAGDKPGWGSLERLERILEKPYKNRLPIEQEHSNLFEQILPLMRAIKNSWRHQIHHVENKLEWMDTEFSPQVTEEIRTATRGFMRGLATKLPE